MSRQSRLKEYADPMKGPHGAGRDRANLNYWSNRAEENSDGADHRATGTERAEAHSTGKRTELRDTAMSPRTARNVDAAMRGADEDDLNHVGSPFMRDVRRTS